MGNNVSWQYDKNGTPTALYIDVAGANAIKVDVSGINRREAMTALQDAQKGKYISTLDNFANDGRISLIENNLLQVYLNDRMRDLNISGSVENISLVKDSSMPSAQNSALLQNLRSHFNGSGYEFSKARLPSRAFDKFDVSQSGASIDTGRYKMEVELKGLSAAEARQLEQYFTAHPEEEKALKDLAHNVAQDGRVTTRENALLNNAGEQAFIRAGVSADVGRITIEPSLKPPGM